MRTLRAGEVEVGTELPELVIPVTASLIVAGALASRDFEPVHHDHAAATSQGSKDIFMNILTTNGLVGRFVTDWCGPEGIVRRVAIRLGVPNYPGDTMTMSGRVESKDEDFLTVAVRGANAIGDHVTGTVEVTLP